MMALAPDRIDGKAHSVASMSKMASIFSLPKASFKRRMSKAVIAREKVVAGTQPYVQQFKKRMPTIYTKEYIKKLHDFILNKSNNVIRSPNANHTVLVKDSATGEVRQEQKCFYRHSVCELHNEILERFELAIS